MHLCRHGNQSYEKAKKTNTLCHDETLKVILWEITPIIFKLNTMLPTVEKYAIHLKEFKKHVDKIDWRYAWTVSQQYKYNTVYRQQITEKHY